jgi:hypothetical protein
LNFEKIYIKELTMPSVYIPAAIARSEYFVLAADESNRRDNCFPEFPEFTMIRSSSYLGDNYITLGVLKHRVTGEIKLVQSYDNGYNDNSAIEVSIPQALVKFDIVKLSAGYAYPPKRMKDHYAYFQNPVTKEEILFDWNTQDCFKLNAQARSPSLVVMHENQSEGAEQAEQQIAQLPAYVAPLPPYSMAGLLQGLGHFSRRILRVLPGYNNQVGDEPQSPPPYEASQLPSQLS